MYRKEVVYDRETKDYAMYLDGELAGFARTYHEAEVTLDQLVFDRLSSTAAAADTTSYEPIGDCVLCHNPAWHLDESCTGLLCPDHRAQETEWIANRYVAIVSQPGGSGGGGGRILAYCVRCGRPGTTTDPDADYICPACLATTARMERAASTAAS